MCFQLLEFGLFNCVIIFLCGMILYAVVMETSGVIFLIPVAKCDLNLTTSKTGILGGASLFGIICSSHLWGYLGRNPFAHHSFKFLTILRFSADTRGRRAVILPTLFIAFFLSFFASFIKDFYIFAALKFLSGFL